MPYEAEATLTSKGQVTVPADIRQRLDLKPGDKLRFRVSDSGELTIEARHRRSIFDSLADLALPPLGRPIEQAEIDDAVAAAVRERQTREGPA